jgi:hypothetical protein
MRTPESGTVSVSVPPGFDEQGVHRIAHADAGDVRAFLQDLTERAPRRMYGIRQRPPDIAVLLATGPDAGLFGARSEAGSGRVVGFAAWWRSNSEETWEAAAALVLAPTAERPIVAERLLSAVVHDAAAAGVRRFVVGMEPGTAELRSVARRIGLPETRRLDADDVVVELALTAPDETAPADDPVPG